MAELGQRAEAIAEYREIIRQRRAALLSLGGRNGAMPISDGQPTSRSFWLRPTGTSATPFVGRASWARRKLNTERRIRLKPDDVGAYIKLGSLLCDHKRDYEGAIAAFQEAVRLKPDSPLAHLCLGNALRGQGKLGQAEAEYREAIRLKPDGVDAYLNLGVLLSGQKHDYAGAIAALREAIRLKPDSPKAHINLGNALAGQGRLGQAEAEYRQAVRLKPDSPHAHYNLGNARFKAGQAVARRQPNIGRLSA